MDQAQLPHWHSDFTKFNFTISLLFLTSSVINLIIQLMQTWSDFEQDVTDAVPSQWRDYLGLHMHVSSIHFRHML